MLAELAAQGLKLTVVSANGEDTIRTVLGERNEPLIEGVAAGVSLFGKRNKLIKMAKLTGVARSETVVIGDELRDLDAARAAGMAFGAVSWGATRADAMAARGADLVFETMDHIVPALLGKSEA
jgi:phosphoglycolate phosphatase